MNIERIKQNVRIKRNGCWEWQRSCNSAGYGQLTEDKVYWLAHRYSFACSNKRLKDTDVIRHRCHNTKCCNPNHLIKGTHLDNYFDSFAKHKKADALRRGTWIIKRKKYPTIRIASDKTGIHQSTILKHTVNGVFNLSSYRAACLIANKEPKV